MLRRVFLKVLAGLFAAPAVSIAMPRELPDAFERDFLAESPAPLLDLIGKLIEEPFEGYGPCELIVSRIDVRAFDGSFTRFARRGAISFRRVSPVFAVYYLPSTGETYRQLAIDVYGTASINQPGLQLLAPGIPRKPGRHGLA